MTPTSSETPVRDRSISQSDLDPESRVPELLIGLATASENGLVLLDREGRVRWSNPALMRVTGFSTRELLGQAFSLESLVPSVEAPPAEDLLATAKRLAAQSTVSRHVRKDGAHYTACVVTTVVRDDAGAVVGFAQTIRELRADERANQEVLRTEERYRAMIDSVRDYAIFMIDPDGVIQTWNLGAERTKGYQASEIIGQKIERFYTAEDRTAGRPAMLLRQAEEHGRVEDVGWRVRKDGTPFWADVVITAIRDQTGKLRGYVKVTRDLTERRQAEEDLRQSEERFRLLVEGVKDYAIFMLDPQGRVATWNIGAERIKGYRQSEIIGEHFSRFYPAEDVAAGKPKRELEEAAREGRVEDEGWRVRKDGTRFWASVVITALRNRGGTLLGFAKVTRDLTLRVRAEEERIRLAKAEEAVRLRDDFLSIASHELRTPLTSLQLQIDSIAEGASAVDAKTVTRIERARRSLRRLLDLVEALLDVSRISAGKLTLKREATDLGAVAAEVIDRLGYSAQGAGCTLRLNAQPKVVGNWDRLRIDQVLSNLLSNAFRYASGSLVEVEVRREDGSASLVVRDHGPGVPDEAKRRIFERFERAASQRHYGGLGLGLFVAQEIVEQHGGRISVDDAPGGGARFTVVLPL